MKRFRWLHLLVLLTATATAGQNQPPAPTVKLVSVTLPVRNYDAAAKWYSENLGFEVRDNKDMRPGKRWVAMFSKDNPSFQIFLFKPGDGYMPVAKTLPRNRIGKETFRILHTNDFDAMLSRFKAGGVRLRSKTYPIGSGGKEIVFEDLYGNLWVLTTGADR